MSITKQHADNDAALEKSIAGFQAEFDGLGEKQNEELAELQKKADELQAKHLKQTQELQEKLIASEKKARENHRAEFNRINAEADKAHLAAIEKEQAAQKEAMDALGDKHRWHGMTAKQIAKNAASDVIAEAEALGLKDKKGNLYKTEKAAAPAIAEHLSS